MKGVQCRALVNLERLHRIKIAVSMGLTLICLPLNRDSSKAREVLTDSLSENSIYANLQKSETLAI